MKGKNYVMLSVIPILKMHFCCSSIGKYLPVDKCVTLPFFSSGTIMVFQTLFLKKYILYEYAIILKCNILEFFNDEFNDFYGEWFFKEYAILLMMTSG